MYSHDSSYYPLINNFNSLDFQNLNFKESKYPISKEYQKPSPFAQNGIRVLSKVNTPQYKITNPSPYSKETPFFQSQKFSSIDNFLLRENDCLFSKNNISETIEEDFSNFNFNQNIFNYKYFDDKDKMNNNYKMNFNIINMNNNNIINNLYMNDNMNYMNMINNNYMSMNYFINNSEYITIFFSYDTIISIKANIKERISKLIERYKKKANIFEQDLEFFFNDKVLNPNI